MTIDDNILFLEKINEAEGDGRVLGAVLDEFAAAVRKGERDACLEIIEQMMKPPMTSSDDAYLVLDIIADKIRSRG